MEPVNEYGRMLTRRHFFGMNASGIGIAALAGLLGTELSAETAPGRKRYGGLPGLPHFAPKARRVIYLFQSGGPACQDLFDYKPLLNEKNGEPLPEQVRGTQRLTGMSANQAVLPLAGPGLEVIPQGPRGVWGR